MSRPRSADPKSVKIGVAVTEATAAGLDVVRGDVARSPYVEALVLADLAARNGTAPVKPARKTAPKTRRTDAPTAAELARERTRDRRESDAAREVPFSAADTQNCPHPKARVHKGLCGACGENVGG